jgi:hypothetical protein
MKKAAKDLTLIASTDWARLSAFIDGEGCVTLKRRKARARTTTFWGSKPSLCLLLQVTNTDPRLVEWLAATFGGRVGYFESKDARYKGRYDWQVTSSQAEAMLTMCLPYLLLKKEQAEIGLAFQKTVGRRGRVRGDGHGRLVSGQACGLNDAVAAQREEFKARLTLLNKKGPKESVA